MKFIKVFHVPFGDVFIHADAIGAILPAKSDPGADHRHGCCVVVHGQEIRVKETFEEVMELITEPAKKGASHGARKNVPSQSSHPISKDPAE